MGRLHCLLPLWMMLFLTMGMFPFFSTLMTAVVVNQVMIVIVVRMRGLRERLLASASLTRASGKNHSHGPTLQWRLVL